MTWAREEAPEHCVSALQPMSLCIYHFIIFLTHETHSFPAFVWVCPGVRTWFSLIHPTIYALLTISTSPCVGPQICFTDFALGKSKTHQTLQAEPVEPGCSRSNNIGQKAVWPFGSSGLVTWTLMGAYHPVRTRRGGITGQLWHGCTLGPPGTPCVMTIDPGDSTEGLVELRIDGFGVGQWPDVFIGFDRLKDQIDGHAAKQFLMMAWSRESWHLMCI